MPAPPFIYDHPSTYTFAAPTERSFNPRAATQASWAPKVPRTKPDGPLINFNKHPDSYAVPYQANLGVKPMHPSTRSRVQRARYVQLFLRVCALLGALGLLFCAIAINKTSTTVAWIIRVAPSVALVHTVYGIYHLCRAAEGRTPTSTASYMVFAAIVDAGLIPFLVFSAYVSYLDYSSNQFGWNTLFNKDGLSYKIIHVFFVLNATVAGILVVSLALDGYLATMFRKIARMPPDMNPLEPTLTSRPHKRNKSSVNITEKHMSNSTVVANRELAMSGKRIPFIHTRTDSADSVTLYGNEDARMSRVSIRKEINDSSKDPYRQSRSSYVSSRVSLAPTLPTSVKPASHSRPAGAGLGSSQERTSMPYSTPAQPASWLSYANFEGVPSRLSETANQELEQEVPPLSPVSALSSREPSPDRQRQEQQNWYSGSNNGNASRVDINTYEYTALAPPPVDSSRKKRSREPLGMNPPTPRGTPGAESPPVSPIQDENRRVDSCPYGSADYGTSIPVHDETFLPQREALVPTNGNATSRPLSARPSSFVGSGGKTRFYGNLRNSFGSFNGDHRPRAQDDGIETQSNNLYYQEDYSRTKTMQSDEGSANFEVYASDSEREEPTQQQQQHSQPSERITRTANSLTANNTWNSRRQVSNSTAHDLHAGYAGLGAEFGKGMAARRREVSGKVAEEGRSVYATNTTTSAHPLPSPDKEKLGAAGWARFKGL